MRATMMISPTMPPGIHSFMAAPFRGSCAPTGVATCANGTQTQGALLELADVGIPGVSSVHPPPQRPDRHPSVATSSVSGLSCAGRLEQPDDDLDDEADAQGGGDGARTHTCKPDGEGHRDNEGEWNATLLPTRTMPIATSNPLLLATEHDTCRNTDSATSLRTSNTTTTGIRNSRTSLNRAAGRRRQGSCRTGAHRAAEAHVR